MILGSGEQLSVECEGCGLGYEGPRGYIDEWHRDPIARRFQIAALESYHATRDGMAESWRVVSTDGDSAYLADLYVTEEEALTAAAAEAREIEEREMEKRQRKRRETSKSAWSIRYHRAEIKKLERQIAWHQSKIEAQR